MHQLMAATLDHVLAGNPADSRRGPQPWFSTASALADDRAADAQGLDRAEGGRRPAGRRHVPGPPGADRRYGQARASQDPGNLDEKLPARGVVRRGGSLRPELAALAPQGTRRMGANPHANGGALLARSAAARFLRLCRGGAAVPGRSTPRPPACRGSSSATCCKLNAERRNFRIFSPDETHLEPLERRLRSDQPAIRRHDILPGDDHLAPKAASWRCSASTSARAGSKAICSPAGTASSPATRPSSTSSIRCSINTPSG